MKWGGGMKGKRCQVCDGSVVNGRCRLCGMPYRNDEVLYHLNENKETHYEHATAKAREIMQQQQIPLGDSKKTAGKSTYHQNIEHRNGRQTLTKEQIRAQQERVRKEAMQKMTTTRVPVGMKQTKGNEKKNNPGRVLWLVALIYLILMYIGRQI